MSEKEIKKLENRIKELESHNKIIQEELDLKTNDYKKMTMEIGQVIFQNEDYEYEIRKLKSKIEEIEKENIILKQENQKLKEFKEEIENSTTWKLKSMMKK